MGACARNMQSDPAEIKPAQCCIKLVFHLTYTMMHGSTKLKLCGPCLHSDVTEQFGRSDSNESVLKFKQEGCWVVWNMSYSRGIKYVSGIYTINCALAISGRIFFNSISQGRFTFLQSALQIFKSRRRDRVNRFWRTAVTFERSGSF